MKVLIVEDEFKIADQIASRLKKEGFVTKMEHDGEYGQHEGEIGKYNAIVLDIGLPTKDGISVLKYWRDHGIDTPVIILTARNSKKEVVDGLEAGADDYLTKPFELDELVARIKSNIRRHHGNTKSVVSYHDVEFDISANRFVKAGDSVKLTRTEHLITQYLFINQGKTCSVSDIAEHAYDDFDNDSGIIARHIANIRKKIGADIIKTDSNRGYFVAKE